MGIEIIDKIANIEINDNPVATESTYFLNLKTIFTNF